MEEKVIKVYDYKKEMKNLFNSLVGKYNLSVIWLDLVTMLACAISNSVDKSHFAEREEMYMQTINKYTKEEQNVFPKMVAIVFAALKRNPEQDFLGSLYMGLGLGNKGTSQFFTPYHICQLMSEITIGNVMTDVREKGYITIHDPCCGAGATLIAGINTARKQLEDENMNYQNHILIVAQDIDFTVAAMCYIQLSILGAAGYVKVGNALTEPVCENDNVENYWFTPATFSKIWIKRLFEEKAVVQESGEKE